MVVLGVHRRCRARGRDVGKRRKAGEREDYTYNTTSSNASDPPCAKTKGCASLSERTTREVEDVGSLGWRSCKCPRGRFDIDAQFRV